MQNPLDTIIDSIISTIKKSFKNREIDVVLDSPFDKKIKTPAVRLTFAGIDEGEDKGDDRDPVRFTITAYCVLSNQTEKVERQILSFGTDLFRLVRKNTWKLGDIAERPENITGFPAYFNPEKEGFESYGIRWEQTFYLGESCWKDEGTLPLFVWWGKSPDIGKGHEDDYDLASKKGIMEE